MGDSGATCFFTLSDKTRDISKKQWDIDRIGMVCTSPKSFADWKTTIEKLCEKTKSCTYEEWQQINAFFNNVARIGQM